MRLIRRLEWRAVHAGKINYKSGSISDSLVFHRKYLMRAFLMKYNTCHSFYSNFGVHIISPGRISGVASHGHGASSSSLWGEEWLVLGCHYKSIMQHLCKWNERSLVFITNAHQASAMAQVRGQSDPVAPTGDQQSTRARNPWRVLLWGGGSAQLLHCWVQGTSKQEPVWNTHVWPAQCHTVGNQLQPLKIFILSWSLHPVKHNEPPKLTPRDSNIACLGEGGIILKQ